MIGIREIFESDSLYFLQFYIRGSRYDRELRDIRSVESYKVR